jgi:hypothetical protein
MRARHMGEPKTVRNLVWAAYLLKYHATSRPNMPTSGNASKVCRALGSQLAGMEMTMCVWWLLCVILSPRRKAGKARECGPCGSYAVSVCSMEGKPCNTMPT